MSRLLFFVFCGSLLAGGCQKPVSRVPASGFSVNQLIDEQVALLEKHRAMAVKQTLVGQVADRYRTDSLNWAEELEPFRQADITALMDSYLADTLSASTVSLRLKKGENLPVQFLEIIRDSLQNTLKIKGMVRSNNYLFDTERTLTLELRNGRLHHYSLEGFQQIFYRDPEPYDIRGQVIWPEKTL